MLKVKILKLGLRIRNINRNYPKTMKILYIKKSTKPNKKNIKSFFN